MLNDDGDIDTIYITEQKDTDYIIISVNKKSTKTKCQAAPTTTTDSGVPLIPKH